MKRNTKKPDENIPLLKRDGMLSSLQQQLKGNSFTVPEGYFDTLAKDIEKRIEETEKVAPIRPFPKQALIWAAAASCLIVIALALFLKSEISGSKTMMLSQNERKMSSTVQHRSDSLSLGEIQRNNGLSPLGSGKNTMPAVDSPEQMFNPSAWHNSSDVKPADDHMNVVIKTLAKEGVTDDDVIDYLLDENIDPSDLNN